MGEHRKHEPAGTPSAEVSADRRGYEAPAIAWEQQLDLHVNAGFACAKVSGSNLQCTASPAS